MDSQGKPPLRAYKLFDSKVPTADELVVLSQPLVKAASKIAPLLKDLGPMWAMGGEAGEIMAGVNVKADMLEIVTTKAGCDGICTRLAEYLTLAPAVVEKKLERSADVDGKLYPILVRSYYAELTVDGVKVEIRGDEQIKVGDWDWGDALEFTPDYTYMAGVKVPLFPLSLKSELYLGLGWLDRVGLITQAVSLKQHHQPGHLMGTSGRPPP
jgi:hypothetical protein